jgi:glycyl-tRNA synthetase alpha subunit
MTTQEFDNIKNKYAKCIEDIINELYVPPYNCEIPFNDVKNILHKNGISETEFKSDIKHIYELCKSITEPHSYRVELLLYSDKSEKLSITQD